MPPISEVTMNIIFHIAKIQVQDKDYPFETTFDITDLNHNLQRELKDELLASLLGVEYKQDDEDDDEQPEMFDQPRRGPGRPKKGA